jgi:antitoxin (DNA-binding transcriptional repressor) of toxin-antitoxin stability system
MTIHVNIAEAKAKLSSLVKASLRGEEVVNDREGKPQVRLTPVPEAQQIDREARVRKIEDRLRRMDAIPDREDWVDPLQWVENGLPR